MKKSRHILFYEEVVTMNVFFCANFHLKTKKLLFILKIVHH